MQTFHQATNRAPMRLEALRRHAWGAGLMLSLLSLLSLLIGPLAQAAPLPPEEAQAQALFERHKSALLQLNTRLVGSMTLPSSVSAFLIDSQGLALSTYQGVADHLYRPTARLLSYARPDGRRAPARVLAIDVVNDLALLQTEERTDNFIPLPKEGRTPRPGDALFALGHAEDAGMTITRGSFAGPDLRAGPARLHFIGPMTEHMAGGPTVNAAGALVGISIGPLPGTHHASLLAPLTAVHALLRQARRTAPMSTEQVRAIALEQLMAYQAEWTGEALKAPWKQLPLGPYRVPEFLSERLRCQGDDRDRPRGFNPIQSTRIDCQMRSGISLNEHTASGRLSYTHTLMSSSHLPAPAFANEVDRSLRWDLSQGESRGMARQMCVDKDTLLGKSTQQTVKARVIWCAQGYRELPGLFDITLALATRDQAQQALVSRLNLEGVSWDRGLQLSQRFLKEFQ